MNSKKIIIYDNEILFNILNEIKEVFSFDLIKSNKENIEKFKKNPQKDHLFVCKNDKNEFDNKLILEQKPIKIEKLIEQINLKFLKEKFIYQSDILIKSYKFNLNSREMIKDNKTLHLTEREINLIVFLNSSNLPVKVDELQKKVWDYSPELDTHTVETHIYRLRKKIKEKFNDENFIYSSKKGYSIN